MADGNANLYRVDEWLTTWDSLPPESTELARRRDRHMRRRHRNNPPLHTEYTINYRRVITEVDVASCTQADEDGLSWQAFHTGMQFIDDCAQGSFVILDIFFLSFFHDHGIDFAMTTLSNETEERIMSSRGVIFPVFRNEHFGLIVLFRTGNPAGRVVLYDSDFVPEPGQPYAENVFFIQMQRAREFGYAFHHRMSVINKTDCWHENWGIYISEHTPQQEDDFNCGVYAIMKAMQLNFGTNALSHDRILRTRFMLMYAILGDLSWREEDQENN